MNNFSTLYQENSITKTDNFFFKLILRKKIKCDRVAKYEAKETKS